MRIRVREGFNSGVLYGIAKEEYLVLNLVVVNLSVAAIMLLFTSYLDLEKREVPDKVWLIFGAIGIILQVYEVSNGKTAIDPTGSVSCTSSDNRYGSLLLWVLRWG